MSAFTLARSRALALALAGAVAWVAPLPMRKADAAPATVGAPQPPGYRNAVARAAASVVSVYAVGEISPAGAGPAVQALSVASGVILDRSGLVVTNARLFDAAMQLVVALEDGTPCAATLVGFDADSRIALLKIEAENLKPIELGDMADVAVGDIVLAIGNPPGLGQTVSQGIVGSIGRRHNELEGLIQTDAAVAPGGYGGALVDTSGRLIGITSYSLAIGDGTPSMRLAVPVDRVREVVRRLSKKGRDA